MTRLIYCILAAAFVGWSNSPPAQGSPDAKTVQDAREELQSRIDRVIGGQNVVDSFNGRMAIFPAAKRNVNMEIVRVVKKVDGQGKAIPDQFVAAIRVSGEPIGIGRQPRESLEFECKNFTFQDGKWQWPQFD